MTENEWMTYSDPTPMLEFLRGKASDRKLRLFAVACCRHVEFLLNQDYVKGSRRAIEVLESHVDGLASEQELRIAWSDAAADAMDAGHAIAHPAETDYYATSYAADAVNCIRYPGIDRAAYSAAKAIAYDAIPRHGNTTLDRIAACWKTREWLGRPRWDADEGKIRHLPDYERALRVEQAFQSCLLRDIIGNLFRPVTIDQVWMTTNFVTLAQTIYDERAFDRLPALADALEKAGCHDTNILGHCRQPGTHVRGCWVVDFLLGKE